MYKFLIQSMVEKEDLKNYLYFDIFKRKKMIVPIIFFSSMAGSFFITYTEWGFSIIDFIIFGLLFFVIGIGLVFLRMEMQAKKRIQRDTLKNYSTMKEFRFYESKLSIENTATKEKTEREYSSFHAVVERKKYFYLYYTPYEVSIIRKKDLDNEEELRGFLKQTFGMKYQRG